VRSSAIELEHLVRQARIVPAYSAAQRVLYLNANLWFGVKAGGSVGHISGVANGLARQGYEVDYAAVSPSAAPAPGVRFCPLLAPSVFGFPAEFNHYRFRNAIIAQLGRLSLADYTGVLLSRKWGVPLVLEYNGSEVWAARNWGTPLRSHRLAAMAEDVCLRHAHLVVTVSDALRDEVSQRGVPRERIVSYPNCIDPLVFTPTRFSKAECCRLRRHYGVDEDAIVAAFIGTFGQWHGVDRLAEAIGRMVDEDEDWMRRTKLHFVLVGDGVDMPKVRAKLGDARYQPFCTLTGTVPQEQAAGHLAMADFVLSPHVPNPDGTPFFGSPTKLFEYMAMGKGILASELEQIGHVLTPALRVGRLPIDPPSGDRPERAVLCNPGNVDELVGGIRFLTENRLWREHLGNHAQREALSRFTWRHHVEAILEGLGRVLGEELT
jgi:glycosyltransferase involved in cell wall biosynthesis